jgi:L-aspartate oxidase
MVPAVDSRRFDFIVIGSGVAGLRAAIEVSNAGRVAVLSKDALHESSSEQAQGGVAVALGDEDRIGLHQEDTIAAGDGLCDEGAVRTMVREGPAYILELIDWGAEFDREGGRLAFTREAAHSMRRVLHSHGDSTGREIVRTLGSKAGTIPNVELLDYLFSVDLIIGEDGRCAGVWLMHTESGGIFPMLAGSVMLATGGCGRLYKATSNPPFATSDGVAIAARAGAELMDMEFFQFHPTTLNLPGTPNFLLTEAIRGEGGVLRNRDGERFMQRYHSDAELAPRDVVARSIMAEVRRQKDERIFLDLSGLDPAFARKRFPMIDKTLKRYNLNLVADLIPVLPAAHYCMGGVRTDRWGRTSIPGLFAAGEVACTGVHGANRLASNSLLEGLVFGGRCGEAMVEEAAPTPQKTPFPPKLSALPGGEGGGQVERLRSEMRETMWRRVGIERCGSTLEEGRERLQALRKKVDLLVPERGWLELRNMSMVGEIIASFAIERRESRGAHFRTDYPEKDDLNWLRHQVFTAEQILS